MEIQRVDISERLGVTDAVRVSLSRQDGSACFPLTRELCVEPQPQTSSGMLFSVTYSETVLIVGYSFNTYQRPVMWTFLSSHYIMVRQSCLLDDTFLTYNATHSPPRPTTDYLIEE